MTSHLFLDWLHADVSGNREWSRECCQVAQIVRERGIRFSVPTNSTAVSQQVLIVEYLNLRFSSALQSNPSASPMLFLSICSFDESDDEYKVPNVLAYIASGAVVNCKSYL